MEKIDRYGLIGRNISYSFSKRYFTDRFHDENIAATYENFDIRSIAEFPAIIEDNADLKGLNVTIPYKETIIPFLDKFSKNISEIGAVNTIRITKNGKLKGYNTDYYGFKKSLKPLLKSNHKSALILGTGGASKAVAFALTALKIKFTYVSRNPVGEMLSYDQLDAETLKNNQIIINCTPIGTAPNLNKCPEIRYDLLNSEHLVYDLIYNPEETLFLKNAKHYGATTKNGYEMLVFQAEKAWEIWNR